MKKTAKKFDCIYANGCSWTYGSELIDPGLPQIKSHFDPYHEKYRKDHNWPNLLAQGYGVGVYNGSIAGGSNDRIVRTTIRDVSELVNQGLRPFVVIAWSQLHRFELPQGSRGESWRCFVSPTDKDVPRVAEEVWSSWSSDRSDVERWLVDMISLDSFLQTMDIDYVATTVFSASYRNFETYTEDQYFKPYTDYLKKHMNPTQHLLHHSLESYLKLQLDVDYGPGRHPLMYGHKLIADHIRRHMNNTFQFQRQ